jgi:hypothetical protein
MAERPLEQDVIAAYIKGFYGHGDYAAPYWFVGMEFGGGDTAAEVASRIQGWHDRGRRELEDLGGPNGIARNSRWFQPNYPLQATWKHLIRVLLSAEGKPTTNGDIREYQKEQLGRAGGQDCILELLPLPSPGLNLWRHYPDTGIEYLKTRELYTAHVAPQRAALLRKRIAKYRPPAVIFYGSGYTHWWREVAGVDFRPSSVDRVSFARSGGTLYVIIQHPAARGLRGTYFEAVGQLIAAELRSGT